MLKINPGIVFGGGMGAGRKGASTHNTVWSLFPLPCLPSFASDQPSGRLRASEDSRGALPRP